jgi:predicted metal-dependent hydrolase
VEFKKSKRAKRLRITIRPFEPVVITMPHKTAFKSAESFLFLNRDWIISALEKIKIKESQAPGDDTGPVDKDRARRYLIWKIAQLADLHGYEYGKVSVRSQKSIWGSCSGQNNISLNMNLMKLPAELIEYVIIHELAHTVEKNHGPGFWAEMAKKYNNSLNKVMSLRRELKKYHP